LVLNIKVRLTLTEQKDTLPQSAPPQVAAPGVSSRVDYSLPQPSFDSSALRIELMDTS
jgi:hypothetical protein